MAYVVPIHRPSTIRHALRINLLDPDDESLVVAKTNRIEIWQLSKGILSMVHSKVVHGTISMLQKLCPKDSATSILFVGTDRFEYFSLEWNLETSQLDTVDSIYDVGEKYMRDSQSQDRCMVDPSGRFMAMSLWEGVLSILRLRLRKGQLKTLDYLEQVRLSEIFLRAGTFIHTETGHPKIALLYQTKADFSDSMLAIYRLTSDDRDTTASKFDPQRDREFSMNIEDPGASLLIPVDKVEDEKRHNVRNVAPSKAHLGGLLVIGEGRLVYIDDLTRGVVEMAMRTSTIFVAWTKYSQTEYILGDDYGSLHLLTIVVEGDVVTSLDLRFVGKATRAACLVYLGDDMLFVGSHCGDSQLFHLDTHQDASQTLDLFQVLPNIGPILDFTVMDMGNREDDNQLGNEYSSGQARIVTGSGAHSDGSLRSVRSGVGLEDVGILGDLKEVRGLFTVRSPGSLKADALVASFLTETRVFKFDSNEEIEEVEDLHGLRFDSETLLASSLPNNRLLQVTPQAVFLLDAESGVAVSTWDAPQKRTITRASANDKWVLLSVGGTQLVSLSIEEDLTLAEQQVVGDDQVSCIHASPDLPDVGLVGFWSKGSISVLDLRTLSPLHSETLRRKEDNASVPRDIILAQVLPPSVGGPTLFVAMDDGNVVSFAMAKSDLSLSGRKSVVLGTQQARFHLLPNENMWNVFVTTEHPSLIYSSEGRIVYSAVTADDATVVCALDTEAFPGAVAVATDSHVRIARIDTERRTHVRTLEMRETVRRIAYSPSEKVFGLGCVSRELLHGDEVVSSSFRLLDEVVFDKLGKQIQLLQAPAIEVVETLIRAELPDCDGHPNERFIIGTGFLSDEKIAAQDETRMGRILVIGVDKERNPYILLSHSLKGSCRRLAVMDGLIVAALTKAVVLFRYDEDSSATASLTRIASYRPATWPVDLAIHGNQIAVADLMKSVSIVEYVPPRDGKDAKLVEVCRHYQAAWSTAVAHIEGDSWLLADGEGNLMALRRRKDGVTLEDRRRMEVTSEMNLGEMVNKVRKITVETSPGALIVPKAFLATVEGAIYMFGTVAPHAQDLLMRFQAKLEEAIKSPGKVAWKSYRSFRNAEREGDGPFRFIDGELLERFLDVDVELQKEICEGLGPSVEDMRNTVENLKRMH